MALKSITARYECDTCGKEILVFMDPALEVNGGSLADAAEHELGEDLMTDVSNGQHTCQSCTMKADEEENGEVECLACGKDCKGECDYRYEEARERED
jgi:hypothetical protein